MGKKAVKPLLTSSDIQKIAGDVNNILSYINQFDNINASLSGMERKRLISAGVKNWGLMEKAFDIAKDNPQFVPPFYNLEQAGTDLREFEELRQLVLELENILQIANDLLLIKSDKCYREALRVYGNLRELSRTKVPGAEPLFASLMAFFRKKKRAVGKEPTVKELEKDFKKLLHGKADGEIQVVNESPKVTAGVHKVVDNVRKGKKAVKEIKEEEME
jgi:hypothetical protein